MKSMHRGWHIGRDPLNKEKLRAVKGNESITGTEEELQEAFLPYLTNKEGQTLYQVYINGQLLLAD